MSKNISSICKRNLWQNNFNNETKVSTICQQLDEHPDIRIYRRKYYKPLNVTINTFTNNGKRYLLPREKYRKPNIIAMPNNRDGQGVECKGRVATKYVNSALNFKENVLQPNDCAKDTVEKRWKSCQNNNLHMHSKYAEKVLNLHNSQKHQYDNHFSTCLTTRHYPEQQNPIIKSNMRHKTLNVTNTLKTKTIPCCPRETLTINKYDKNLHCLSLCHNSENLQLHPNKSYTFPSYTLPMSEYDLNSHLTWLPKVSQQREYLFGMFEVLPSVFLLKPIPPFSRDSMKAPTKLVSTASGKYSNYLQQCNLFPIENFEKQQQFFLDYNNTVKSPLRHSLYHPRPAERINCNCGKLFKKRQTKSKITDRDIIFGNACLLIRKHYGWEKSRIDWLLQLEQEEQKNNSKQVK